MSTPEELCLIELVKNRESIEILTGYIMTYNINLNIHDTDGSSLLLLACYYKNHDFVRFLLNAGVDVNDESHYEGYTALHFAALVADSDVVRTLLDYGAKRDVKNRIGRTAAEMATFVGQLEEAQTINHYIYREDLEYFLAQSSFYPKPVIEPELLEPIREYMMQVPKHFLFWNFRIAPHPIRVALNTPPELLQNVKNVRKVLREMRGYFLNSVSEEGSNHELLGIKMHYLSFVLSEYSKTVAMCVECDGNDPLEVFVRKFMITQAKRGPDYVISFFRECLDTFPFKMTSLIYKQLANPENSEKLADMLPSGMNKFGDRLVLCSTCYDSGPKKKCSKCMSVQYCDRECQRLHWFLHKRKCGKLSQNSSMPPPPPPPPRRVAPKDKKEITEALTKLNVS